MRFKNRQGTTCLVVIGGQYVLVTSQYSLVRYSLVASLDPISDLQFALDAERASRSPNEQHIAILTEALRLIHDQAQNQDSESSLPETKTSNSDSTPPPQTLSSESSIPTPASRAQSVFESLALLRNRQQPSNLPAPLAPSDLPHPIHAQGGVKE
jgi:hypothetical protein